MPSFPNIRTAGRALERPSVIFTIHGDTTQNPKSVSILFELSRLLENSKDMEILVFKTEEETREFLQDNAKLLSAIVIFDSWGVTKHFTYLARDQREKSDRFPTWANGAKWGIQVFSRCRTLNCANQIRANFIQRFETQIRNREYPWGKKKHEKRFPETGNFAIPAS